MLTAFLHIDPIGNTKRRCNYWKESKLNGLATWDSFYNYLRHVFDYRAILTLGATDIQ